MQVLRCKELSANMALQILCVANCKGSFMQKLERYIRQYTMTEEQPWLLQTFLQGPEYSCYTLAHQGQVVAHVDNLASLSCLNYAHGGIPEV